MTLCGALLFGFSLSVCCDIVTRLLGSPWLWLQEVTSTLFIYAIFLGAAVATRRNDHLYLTAFAEALQGSARAAAARTIRGIVRRVAMALICAASHPLADRGTVPLRDLAGETFVDFPVGWGTRAIVDRAFAAAGIDRQVSFEVADYATAAALVGNGLGVAFVPASAARELDGVARLAVDPPLDWRILVATSATRRASAAARAFLGELLSPRD